MESGLSKAGIEMNREVVQGEGEGGTKNSHGAEKGGAPLSLSVSTVHLPLLLPLQTQVL